MPTSVFVSSTINDLLDHRAAVVEALIKAGFSLSNLASFLARSQEISSYNLGQV